MKPARYLLAGLIMMLVACSSPRTHLPVTEGEGDVERSSTVFVGHARAFRFAEGRWLPLPEQDYNFMVLEKRYADRWEVIKEIYHRHPGYDGRAGAREQTLFFVVRTSAAADSGLDLAVEGSLGSGRGHETADGLLFMELAAARRGWFIPFDTIRIRQRRGVMHSRLEEEVELFLRKAGGEVPFMKLLEEGVIYKPVAP